MVKQIRPIFNGKQDNMCNAVILGWENNKLYLKNFSDKDLKYTKEYADDAIKEANDVKKMPDISVRRSVPVSQKEVMKGSADTAISNYLVLIGLIQKIWTADQWEAVKNLAGYAKYTSAAGYNWADLDSMLESGAQFISDNTEKLLNDGKGMLPGFPNQYTETQAAYSSLFNQYLQAKQGVNIQTNAKVEKLNAVYSKFMFMSDDAKKYFRKDKDKIKLFAYTKLYEKVAGSKSGGYHITLKSEGDGLPVTTSTITFQPGNKSFYADEKGIIEARLKEGTYTYTLTTPGYQSREGTLKVDKKVMHRIELVLQKEAATA